MLAGSVSTEPTGSKLVQAPSGERTKPCPRKFASKYDPVIAPDRFMLLGLVAIEPGGSNLVKADFCALADRLSPSVQRARRKRASLAFCRVIGTIGAAKSGCMVIGSAPSHNARSMLSRTRK